MHVIMFSATKDIPIHPCSPSPCGPNAICKERNEAGSCSCIEGFHGDPYLGCRPECVMNSDCSSDKSCFNNKCVDPCPGICGQNAVCSVINHAPSCYCTPGFSGNSLHACYPITSKIFSLLFTFLNFNLIYLYLPILLSMYSIPTYFSCFLISCC